MMATNRRAGLLSLCLVHGSTARVRLESAGGRFPAQLAHPLSRRAALATGFVGLLTASRADAKQPSRAALLNQLAHLVLARRRIERMQGALVPSAASASQRVLVSGQCKALFRELDFRKNVVGAGDSVPSAGRARYTELSQDTLEFLASVVTFDGLDAFEDPTNEAMLARETTPAKLEYVRKAVDKSARSLDALMGLFDTATVQQATELARESGIS